MIFEIGTAEKSLSFPIGLATTKTTNKPNIVLCDTGHNMVKVFSWTGDLKMVLKTEEVSFLFFKVNTFYGKRFSLNQTCIPA